MLLSNKDKALLDEAFNIAKIWNMIIKEVLLLCFINFFDTKSSALANKYTKRSGFDIKQIEQSAKELHKQIIRKF